jgi:hypothetical protein
MTREILTQPVSGRNVDLPKFCVIRGHGGPTVPGAYWHSCHRTLPSPSPPANPVGS